LDALGSVRADHFVYTPQLTLACASRAGIDLTQPRSDKIELALNHGVAATVAGATEEVRYLPRNQVAVTNEHWLSDLGVPEAIKKFQGDLENNLQNLSAILLTDSFVQSLRDPLEAFIRGLGTKIPPRVVTNVVDRILTSTQQESGFKFYYPPDIRPFHTADYETSLCNLSGWYNFKLPDNSEYRIKMHRRTIFSKLRTTKAKDVPYTVPLVEEIEIQLNARDNDKWVGFPKAYVVVCKATKQGQSSENGRSASQLHFLGDNAFTIPLPGRPLLPVDKYAAIMHLVGWVQSKLQEVTCQDLSKLGDAKKFFAKLIEGDDSTEAYYNELIRAEQPTAGVPDFSVMKRSFLSNQHAHDMTAIQGNNHFITKQWFVSFGLGLVAISPFSDPHRTYVFVWARDLAPQGGESLPQAVLPYDPPAPVPQRPNTGTIGHVNKFNHRQEHPSKFTRHSSLPIHRSAAASSSFPSTLPPELERELELL
jgi:hypothetical protein